MHVRRTLILLTIVALGGMRTSAQNQFRDWQDTALADNPRATPKQACAALVSQTGYDFSILSAAVLPAATDVPGYAASWASFSRKSDSK